MMLSLSTFVFIAAISGLIQAAPARMPSEMDDAAPTRIPSDTTPSNATPDLAPPGLQIRPPVIRPTITIHPIPFPLPTPVPAPPAAPPATAGPAGFNITNIGLNGSGCPIGTTSYVLSPDKSAVTILFSQYTATTGPTIAKTENRKNCQITLTVR
jgi:hypothetical protein